MSERYMLLNPNVRFIAHKDELFLFKNKDMATVDLSKNNGDVVLKILELAKERSSIENASDVLQLDETVLESLMLQLSHYVAIKQFSHSLAFVGTRNIIDVFKLVLKNSELRIDYIELSNIKMMNQIIQNRQMAHFDLVIFFQNMSISPLYRVFHEHCNRMGLPVLNTTLENDNWYVGPYFSKEGSLCYNCYDSRKDINNINAHEVRLKHQLIDCVDDYDDSHYSHFTSAFDGDRLKNSWEQLKNIVIRNDFSSFERSVLQIEALELSASDSKNYSKDNLYEVVSMPSCKTCSENLLNKPIPLRQRSDTHRMDRSFINEHAGMFRKMQTSKTMLKGGEIHYYTIQVPCIFNGMNGFFYNDRYHFNIAGGVAAEKNRAIGKAIGEAIERYCLEAYRVDDLRIATQEALDQSQINRLMDIDLFLDWQYDQEGFKYVRVHEHMPIPWVEAEDLIQNKKIMVPATFVYTRFKKTANANYHIGKLSTSGAACSTELKNAITHGILELIERDCIMITWLQKLAVERVQFNLETIDNPIIQALYRLLNKNQVHLNIFNMTLDLEIPCFLVIGKSENPDLPSLLFGAGCRLDKEEALIRALEEIVQGCGWSKSSEENKSFERGENYCNVDSFRKRVSLYADAQMTSELDFLIGTRNTTTFESIQSCNTCGLSVYDFLKNVLIKNHLSLIVKDLTTPDIAQLGFIAVKVFIPELQQVESDHNYRFIKNERIWTVPQRLGFKNIKTDPRNYNPCPHPLP